jgi:hypothetical protein
MGRETYANSKTNAQKWRVVSYQIPVPEGDCSIHVRLGPQGDLVTIIMDGGMGNAAAEKIDEALTKIKGTPGAATLTLAG